jgi:hypothetical protein
VKEYNFPEKKYLKYGRTGVSSLYRPKIRVHFRVKKQNHIGAAISWECGRNVPAVCSVSGSENYIPPVVTHYSCFRNWCIIEEFF